MMKLNTSPGLIMGTVNYMSPEQARGTEVDARSDVFSLGVLLYELIIARVPFDGETPSHTIVSILEHEPDLIADMPEGAPDELLEVIGKALRKDRDARYQTMREMLSDLQELRDLLALEARQQFWSDSAPRSSGRGTVFAKSTGGPSGGIARDTRNDASFSAGMSENSFGVVRRRGPTTVLSFFIVLVLIGAAIWFYESRSHGRVRAAPSLEKAKFTKIVLPTEVGGWLSPDGKYVAYVQALDEGVLFWVKQLAAESSVQVAEFHNVSLWGSGFSRDSNFLYCTVGREGERGELYRVPVLGGTPHKLIEDISTNVMFSPDGKQMVYRRIGATKNDVDIVLADTEGGNQRVIASANYGQRFLCMSFDWNPSGRAITCANRESNGKDLLWYLSELSVDGGPERRIIEPSRQAIRSVQWLPDGSGMIVIAEGEVLGAYQLWFLATGDHVMNRLTRDTANYTAVNITADGTQMLTSQFARDASIWVGPTSKPARAQPVLPGPAGFDKVAWLSRDQLVFDNEGSLWTAPSTGGQLRHLISNLTWANNPCVAADGRYVVFSLQDSNGWNIWRVDADGNNMVQMTKNGATEVSCSPNGNWVLFATGAINKWSLWREPVTGGEPSQIVEECNGPGALSPDGKLVAYEFRNSADPNTRIAVKSVDEKSGPLKVFDDSSAWNQIKWAPDGHGLYYISARTGNLVDQPLSGGPPRTLVEHGKEHIYSAAFSPDGEQLAYVKGTNLNSLVLISNFQEGKSAH